ncbi:(R)-mandelonitrile lyase-like [Citrus sinensis]|nr:(R)-mandelonitrile lyase-like [Citrus sinensis]
MNWDLKVVNESYEWVEEAVVFRPQLRNWQSAVRDGLLEAGVDPYNGFRVDHVVGTKIGGTTFDSSGRRHSAADLLSYANARNIRVAIYASVERVLLAATIGVVYRDRTGRYHHAMVREKGEVILCAGAIGSPQLLFLSGIGARPYLSSLGIPVAYHHPYVGQYMYDNPRNGISIVPPIPLEHSLIQVVGITEIGAYVEAATPSPPLYLTVATLMEKIIGPLSSGSLRLASTDVRVNPIVRFNYFSNPVDVERCINGTRKIGDVLRSRSMDDFRLHEWFGARNFRFVGPALPVDQSDHAQMAEFCRRTVSTIWHYHGGCVVGKVVDRDLRVIGIDALRIVDGSTFSISPGTNPQATLMMLGRYVGAKLIRYRSING